MRENQNKGKAFGEDEETLYSMSNNNDLRKQEDVSSFINTPKRGREGGGSDQPEERIHGRSSHSSKGSDTLFNTDAVERDPFSFHEACFNFGESVKADHHTRVSPHEMEE